MKRSTLNKRRGQPSVWRTMTWIMRTHQAGALGQSKSQISFTAHKLVLDISHSKQTPWRTGSSDLSRISSCLLSFFGPSLLSCGAEKLMYFRYGSADSVERTACGWGHGRRLNGHRWSKLLYPTISIVYLSPTSFISVGAWPERPRRPSCCRWRYPLPTSIDCNVLLEVMSKCALCALP